MNIINKFSCLFFFFFVYCILNFEFLACVWLWWNKQQLVIIKKKSSPPVYGSIRPKSVCLLLFRINDMTWSADLSSTFVFLVFQLLYGLPISLNILLKIYFINEPVWRCYFQSNGGAERMFPNLNVIWR